MPWIRVQIPAPAFHVADADASSWGEHMDAMTQLLGDGTFRRERIPRNEAPRPGGWMSWEQEVPDVEAAEAALRSYWGRHFTGPFPLRPIECAAVATEAFLSFLRVLGLFGVDVPAPLLAGADLTDDAIDRLAEDLADGRADDVLGLVEDVAAALGDIVEPAGVVPRGAVLAPVQEITRERLAALVRGRQAAG